MADESKTEKAIETLRESIKRGDFGKSGRIPTIAQLSKDWSVSRTTVYESLELLQLEGLLIMKGGAYYANWPIMRVPGIMQPSFSSYLAMQGLEAVEENIIEPELVAMPPALAGIFNQSEGIHVVHRMRRQGTSGSPYRLAENWYPANLAEEFLEPMRKDSTLDVIGEIGRVHGLSIDRIHEEAIARIPTTQEAEQLSILKTAPVLEVRCSNFAKDGTPLMWNKIILIATYFYLSHDYSPSDLVV